MPIAWLGSILRSLLEETETPKESDGYASIHGDLLTCHRSILRG